MIDRERAKDPVENKDLDKQTSGNPTADDEANANELNDEQLSNVAGGVAVHKSGDPCDGGNLTRR